MIEDAVRVVGGVLEDGVLSKLVIEQEDHGTTKVDVVSGPVSVKKEAPLAASRFVLPGMTVSEKTGALQDWLNAVPDESNSELRFDERQYEIDATLIVPPVRGLSLGGLGVIGQDSTTVNDGVGTVILPPPNTPAFRFTANMDYGSLTPYGLRFHDFAVRYGEDPTDATPNQIAFFFDDPESDDSVWFHNEFERLSTQNTYVAFGTADGTKSGGVWSSRFCNIQNYGVKKSALRLKTTGGYQPINVVENFGVFNTNTPIASSGDCFDLQGVEIVMIGLDIEGWRQRILRHAAGYSCTIFGLHVEHHVFDAVTAAKYMLLSEDGGKLTVKGASFSGVSGGNSLSLTAMAQSGGVFPDSVVELDDIHMIWPTVTGDLSFFYGSAGSYKLGHYSVAAGSVTPKLAGYDDRPTMLRVCGTDSINSAQRIGPNKEYFGDGVPSNGMGANGDFYKRLNGTVAGKTLWYHKEAGSWLPVIP